MNYQARAFLTSFLLHGVVIILVVIGSTFAGQYKKTMILDFDLHEPPSAGKKVETPAPVKTMPVNSAVRPVPKEKEPPRLQQEVTKRSPSPEITPAVKLPETTVVAEQPMGQGKAAKESSFGIPSAAKEKSGTISGMGNADHTKEAAKVKYLSEHFAYIRDKILRNVSYPDAARRMGWQGNVVLSFIIAANGSVRAFKIIKSSGFTILDNNAVETVKDTAPFPKPLGEAQLVIPITYHLE